MMEMTIVPTSKVTIYVSAVSESPTGPFGWCTRTSSGSKWVEHSGGSGDEHFTRLQLLGCIRAMNAVLAPSRIKVICSDCYLTNWLGAMLTSVQANGYKGKMRNKDVLPGLHAARARHLSVETEVIPQAERDGQHDKAAAQAHYRAQQVQRDSDDLAEAGRRP